jgi:hypothetical protein
VFQELSCAFLGFPHACARSRKDHTLQTSQNELAEPYKYSNSIHTSSTVVWRIPWRNWIRVDEMSLSDQRKSFRSAGFARPNREVGRRQAPWKRGLRVTSCPWWFMGWPGANTKWSNAGRWLSMAPDPSLRSGFRQRAPAPLTPAKRLNLLKKFRASTLTTLWEERTRLLGKRQTGRVHG